MEQKFPEFHDAVYVRPIDVADLSEDLQSELGDLKTVYGIYNSHGVQLALVNTRRLADSVARENEMTVHALN